MLKTLAIITCILTPTCAMAQHYDDPRNPFYDPRLIPPGWEPYSPYYLRPGDNPHRRWAPRWPRDEDDFMRGRRIPSPRYYQRY